MHSWRLIPRAASLCLPVAFMASGLVFSGAHDGQADASAANSSLNSAPAASTPKAAPKAKPKAADPAPVVKSQQTAVPAVAKPVDKKLVAELPDTTTRNFGMVGVTWAAGTKATDFKVNLRTRVEGKWTAWESLDLDDPTGGGRPGTEPIWVGKADGVAVKVLNPDGVKPDDIKVMTIDPGRTASDTNPTYVTPASYSTDGVLDGVVHATQASDGTPTFTPQPSIISRASWGARKNTPCDSPLTGSTTKGVVVHHTAGSNSYTKDQSAAIIRGEQAYHMDGHGWCDIGYNFIVDKYGQIFEGRNGGINKMVRGAHAGNGEVNTYAMGVSMAGNFDTVVPSAALKDAMVKLIGWRLGTFYMKAKGTYYVGEKITSTNGQIDSHHLNIISGHRNVVGTACPGAKGYAWLSASGGLRDRVAAYIANYSTPSKTLAVKLGTSVTGPVRVGETGTTGGKVTQLGKLDIYWSSATGARSVRSPLLAPYRALGGQKSGLGFPSSEYAVTSDSKVGVQRFATGSMFTVVQSTGAKKVFSLWGPTASLYKSLGEAGGKLGVPTSSVAASTTGMTKASFAKGYILYSSTTKKAVAYTSAGTVISTGTTTTASADLLTISSSREFTLRGHGFGHGIGMGQYGAQGAATLGKTWLDIVRFYYPGTSLASKTGNIRVLISKDTTESVIVTPKTGLVFRNVTANTTIPVPSTLSGIPVKQWGIFPVSGDKTRSALRYKMSEWHTYKSTWTGPGQFEGPSTISLVLPDNSTASYRGALRSSPPSTGSSTRDTVNVLSLEAYLRGVVPAEMPSSWKAQALRAQSVAARTYAARSLTPSRYYDICDTTSCQVYRGYAAETAATDTAIAGTAGKILNYGGQPAFTQFSSSSGGYTAAGSQPYLVAKTDPYDDWSGNPVHDWSILVKASTLEKAYPAIGTLKTFQITARNGKGDWGGRVDSLKLIGSTGSVTITGNTARSVLGLRSNWFRVN